MALPIMSAIADSHIHLQDIVKPLDFTSLTLQFMKPDFDRFPLLKIAFEAIEKKASYPIAFNAANEIAVQAFVDEMIDFNQIATVVKATFEHDWSMTYTSLDEVVLIDSSARTIARHVIRGLIE
jgi:1-deoxy-D-xylulose-5-phosphate reductoisomerase